MDTPWSYSNELKEEGNGRPTSVAKILISVVLIAVAFDFYSASIIETIAIAVAGEADTTTAENNNSAPIGETLILGTDLEIPRFHGLTGFGEPDITATKRGG